MDLDRISSVQSIPVFSLIESTGGAVINDLGGTITGVDPLLGSLQDNGGPTKTHALLAGSPAINAGEFGLQSSQAGIPEFDQRGTGFDRVVGISIDLGAVEKQDEALQTVIVDTLESTNDGDFSEGDRSLREALLVVADGGTITFDASLFGQTITLGGNHLTIDQSVTIDGDLNDDGTADITISGNNATRHFSVDSPVDPINVNLTGLVLTDGKSADYESGAAVLAALGSGSELTLSHVTITNSSLGQRAQHNYAAIDFSGQGTVTITNSQITNNDAGAITATGGGTLRLVDSVVSGNLNVGSDSGTIEVRGSTAEIIRSEISGNTAGRGGGLRLFNATTTVTESLISENVATYGHGGGIYKIRGSLTIVNSTISNNAAAIPRVGTGGGIHQEFGSIVIRHSTITGNTAHGSGGIYNQYRGSLLLDHSIVAGNIAQYAVNIGGQRTTRNSIISGDPVLGPLQDNGGPTRTHAPLPGSPAIDAGDATLMAGVGDTPEFDQRGAGFTRVFDGVIDIGAFEVSNRPPVFDSLTSDATFATKAIPGQTVTITGSFSDLDIADTHSIVIDWNDGTSTTMEGADLVIDQVNNTFTATHTFATGGLFDISVTVTDAFGELGTAQTTAVVTGVRVTDDGGSASHRHQPRRFRPSPHGLSGWRVQSDDAL